MSDGGWEQNWRALCQRVARACERVERPMESVEIIAVSKFQPVAAIRELQTAGQRAFGESRVQELEAKAAELAGVDLRWHFIGRLQANKVRKVLNVTPWVHSVDSLELAARLGRIAQELGTVARGFLQVRLGEEETKAGWEPAVLRAQFAELTEIDGLRLEGLMTLPPPVEDETQQRGYFRSLRELRDELQDRHGVALPGLSMGMSDDFELAIAEGATHIRPGSVLFGQRPGGHGP